MTNTRLLEDKIRNAGLKKTYIANKMNLSCYGLLKKIKNENEFKGNEILKLCEILNINDLQEKEEIFFAK